MVINLAGDRLNTEASQVWGAFALVERPLANGFEVALSALGSRDRQLWRIETVPVAHGGLLLFGQKVSVAGAPKWLCAKARDVSGPPWLNLSTGSPLLGTYSLNSAKA